MEITRGNLLEFGCRQVGRDGYRYALDVLREGEHTGDVWLWLEVRFDAKEPTVFLCAGRIGVTYAALYNIRTIEQFKTLAQLLAHLSAQASGDAEREGGE